MTILDDYFRCVEDWSRQHLSAERRERVIQGVRQAWSDPRHGDFSRWLACVEALPDVEAELQIHNGAVSWHADGQDDCPSAINDESAIDQESVRHSLMGLHPWRKGPWEYFGVPVDAEWRSDRKWNRLREAIDWKQKRILDVGCGNGYYGWRMIDAGASHVLGIEPTVLMGMQYLASARYGGLGRQLVLPFRDEAAELPEQSFDVVVSAGVLYHHVSPIEHLRRLMNWLRPGGTMIVETLVAPDSAKPDPARDDLIFPEDRYAQMRNVWFLPSVRLLEKWLTRIGLASIVVKDRGTETTMDEQRQTEWMRFQSLSDFLDPDNPENTIEGLPRPRRAILLGTKR